MRVLKRVKRRDVNVFILQNIVQVSDGFIGVNARAIHGRCSLLLADHFDESVYKLQYRTVSTREKIGAVNVEPRINDALVKTVVFAAPRPEIGVSTCAFKIARLD